MNQTNIELIVAVTVENNNVHTHSIARVEDPDTIVYEKAVQLVNSLNSRIIACRYLPEYDAHIKGLLEG